MKRLCFYCFWITEYSRLIRRYVAKDYYALSDEQLLSIPFFASTSFSIPWGLSSDSSKGTFQRQKKITLNDLCLEILVKEKAMEIHGSLEQMRKTRKLEYEESQRLHWKVELSWTWLISVWSAPIITHCARSTRGEIRILAIRWEKIQRRRNPCARVNILC